MNRMYYLKYVSHEGREGTLVAWVATNRDADTLDFFEEPCFKQHMSKPGTYMILEATKHMKTVR